MPLGVLKWRGGLRGVSSECCEPVNGVARMLKCRLWEQRRSRYLWLQWKWWLAQDCGHWSCRRRWKYDVWDRQGTFVVQFDAYIRLYTKGGRNSTFKVTSFDKIWQNFWDFSMGNLAIFKKSYFRKWGKFFAQRGVKPLWALSFCEKFGSKSQKPQELSRFHLYKSFSGKVSHPHSNTTTTTTKCNWKWSFSKFKLPAKSIVDIF